MIALLLQDAAGPSGNGWYVILALMGGGMGTVFAALMLEMRTRRERAEKQVDLAADDSRKQTAVLAELTLAVREQGTAVKSVADEVRKNREALDGLTRQCEEFRRILSELARTPPAPRS